MTTQIILIVCLLLLLTSLIIIGLCVLNWRLYVALYQGKVPNVWCFGRQSSAEERTAVVDRNIPHVANQASSHEFSSHLEQIEKLKRWHLSQLSSAQSTVAEEESTTLTINQPDNTRQLTKIICSASVETNNNVYEDINSPKEIIEMHQLKPDPINLKKDRPGSVRSERDAARMHYTAISDDYLDHLSICSVRINIPVSSSPVIHHTRNHKAPNKQSWKLSPEPHHRSYEGFESTGVSCIYFNPEPDYEDSGLPETSLARGTLEKKIKEIP